MPLTWALSQQMQVDGSRDRDAMDLSHPARWENLGLHCLPLGVLFVAVHLLSFLVKCLKWHI